MDYKIFVDLDGVLADFDKRVYLLSGKYPHEMSQAAMWAMIIARDYNTGSEFFTELEKMSDADELWNYVKSHGPSILSATGAKIFSADREKREWFARNFCPDTEVIIVHRSFQKHKHAAPNHILIDDRPKSLDPWMEAGGIGILHKNTKDTIEQLKELGI